MILSGEREELMESAKPQICPEHKTGMSFPTTFIDEVPQAQYYFCRNDGCDWRCSQYGEYFKPTDVAARPLSER